MKVSNWTGKTHCEECQLYFTDITDYDVEVCFPDNSMLAYTFVYCPKCDAQIRLAVPPQIFNRVIERVRKEKK